MNLLDLIFIADGLHSAKKDPVGFFNIFKIVVATMLVVLLIILTSLYIATRYFGLGAVP